MSPIIHIEAHGEIPLVPGRPPEDVMTSLTTGLQFYAAGPWGWVSLEEVQTPRFRFRHWFFAVTQHVNFFLAEPDRQVQSLLSRKGTFHHQLSGFPPVTLYEKEFVLFRAASGESRVTACPGNRSSLVVIRYNLPLYRNFLPLFRRFQHDLAATVRKAGYLLLPPKVARYSVHDAVEAIWLDRFLPSLQAHHLELRLQTCLFSQLAQTYSPTDSLPTPLQRERAAAARSLILADIRQHHTIDALAQVLHCSASWLKRAFQKVYGTSLFHFLRETRMERAREMLLRGEPLKVVAIEVGMKPRNFPKEFKAFFGYTVTTLKRGSGA